MLMQKLVFVAQSGASAVLYLLLVLSVISVGVVIERWWYFRKRRLDLATASADLEKQLRAGNVEGARKEFGKSKAVEAEILCDALAWYNDGPEAVQEIVQKGVRQRRKVFESGLLFLGTLGNNAPFIGLFGTVLGVVAAFRELGAAQANMAAAGGGMNNVMGGIAEALVATRPAVIPSRACRPACTTCRPATAWVIWTWSIRRMPPFRRSSPTTSSRSAARTSRRTRPL